MDLRGRVGHLWIVLLFTYLSSLADTLSLILLKFTCEKQKSEIINAEGSPTRRDAFSSYKLTW